MPHRDIARAMSGHIFASHNWEWGATGIGRGEGGRIEQPSTTKNYPAPHVHGAEAEKPCPNPQEAEWTTGPPCSPEQMTAWRARSLGVFLSRRSEPLEFSEWKAFAHVIGTTRQPILQVDRSRWFQERTRGWGERVVLLQLAHREEDALFLFYLCAFSCHQRGKTPKSQMRWVRGKGLQRLHLHWVFCQKNRVVLALSFPGKKST